MNQLESISSLIRTVGALLVLIIVILEVFAWHFLPASAWKVVSIPTLLVVVFVLFNIWATRKSKKWAEEDFKEDQFNREIIESRFKSGKDK